MHIRLGGEKPFHWLLITFSIYLNPLGLLKQNTSDKLTFKKETSVTVLRGKHLIYSGVCGGLGFCFAGGAGGWFSILQKG